MASLILMLCVCVRGWRVGFNSLCALASVNHLHLHAWYLNERLYTEHAVCYCYYYYYYNHHVSVSNHRSTVCFCVCLSIHVQMTTVNQSDRCHGDSTSS